MKQRLYTGKSFDQNRMIRFTSDCYSVLITHSLCTILIRLPINANCLKHAKKAQVILNSLIFHVSYDICKPALQ